MTDQPWWKGAVLYQVYLRSFMDSNGDGIGDLAGITQKLDYIASLGVDAIWVSPFFKSPMKDFGYDVSRYRQVDSIFGDLGDFQLLLKAAHDRGLKVLIDQVWAHTSDEHPWFGESRRSKDNDKNDWYIWADPKPDGTAPNNWLSYFGGVAWAWEPRREQYYLHHFLTCQPALNIRNEAVQEKLFEIAKFWLDMGVDGFRLDVVHQFMNDPTLPDNSLRPDGTPIPNDVPAANPLARQLRDKSAAHPDTIDFLKKLRTFTDQYDGRTLLAEVGGEDNDKLACSYVKGGDALHMAYTFGMMTEKFDKATILKEIDRIESNIDDGWICWTIGNHDVPRVATRWNHGHHPYTHNDHIRLFMALGLSMRGSFCMYQGDELGLPEVIIPHELMQDPFGVAFYPEFVGRDGCRTPMPWDKNAHHAGFSETKRKTWLPIPQPHLNLAVDQQENRDNATLNHYRRFIHWRQQQPAMKWGDIDVLDTPDDVVGFIRRHNDNDIVCLFNISDQPKEFKLDVALDLCVDRISYNTGVHRNKITMAPYGYGYLSRRFCD